MNGPKLKKATNHVVGNDYPANAIDPRKVRTPFTSQPYILQLSPS